MYERYQQESRVAAQKKLVDDFGMNRIPGASQMRLSTVYHLCCGSQLLFAIDTELIGVLKLVVTKEWTYLHKIHSYLWWLRNLRGSNTR